MIVVFSELASAGLKRIFPDEDKREDYRLSIVFFLKARDAERKAFPLDVFPDKQMYLRYLDEIRIMYELVAFGKPTVVWSIKPTKGP
jgi:hypothetical protein